MPYGALPGRGSFAQQAPGGSRAVQMSGPPPAVVVPPILQMNQMAEHVAATGAGYREQSPSASAAKLLPPSSPKVLPPSTEPAGSSALASHPMSTYGEQPAVQTAAQVAVGRPAPSEPMVGRPSVAPVPAPVRIKRTSVLETQLTGGVAPPGQRIAVNHAPVRLEQPGILSIASATPQTSSFTSLHHSGVRRPVLDYKFRPALHHMQGSTSSVRL